MQVLFVIDHAPNYREAFLRKLSEKCKLTVVAQSCQRDNLTPPIHRGEYTYIELNKSFTNKVRFNFELQSIIEDVKPDLVCAALNLRHPIRVLSFMRARRSKIKWVWWGQVYGRNDSKLLLKIKKYLINKSDGCLVYTKQIVERLALSNTFSFDNSQFSEQDYLALPNCFSGNSINCLFVGRPQERKRLELLLDIAKAYSFIQIRLVGPQMKSYFKDHEMSSNVHLYEAASGEELQKHFEWCNLVVNPGHVGLLVMNAACHNRPILIDSKVDHAPEVILAMDAKQYFIDFTDDEQVETFFLSSMETPERLIQKGETLFSFAIQEYTVENMALKHIEFFTSVLSE